jgi:dihydroorotase
MSVSAETLVIRGGRVIDPASGFDGVADVVITNGRIAAIGGVANRADGLRTPPPRELDASGCIVAPGLIDIHVHLRDPGQTHKEDLATGTRAAARGGFTHISCMPNTTPALDSAAIIRDLRERAILDGIVRISPIGAISIGRRGEAPAPWAEMATAGAVAFSDDGDSCMSDAIMRDALLATREHGKPIAVHCEEMALVPKGAGMNAGIVSHRMLVPGIPREAEEAIIARDLRLAEETGGLLHLCHVSTAGGVQLLREAKARGVRATGEAMPHHLALTDEWVAGGRAWAWEKPYHPGWPHLDPLAKVNPPLRTGEDAAAVLAGLKDGTLDCIATDHAPHTMEEKAQDIATAPSGFTGSETALPLLMELVKADLLTLPEIVRHLTVNAARVFGLPGGALRPGAAADVTIFDPNASFLVSEETLVSKSPNTPLLGMRLTGAIRATLVSGRVIYDATQGAAFVGGAHQ